MFVSLADSNVRFRPKVEVSDAPFHALEISELSAYGKKPGTNESLGRDAWGTESAIYVDTDSILTGESSQSLSAYA